MTLGLLISQQRDWPNRGMAGCDAFAVGLLHADEDRRDLG
jgi:hypothetical protein